MRKYGKQTAARSAEDKGFYIILALCLVAIGISGYVLFFAPSAQPDSSMDTPSYTGAAASSAAADGFTAVDGTADVPLPQDAETEEPAQPAAPDAPASAPAPAAQTPQKPVWVRPTAGEVLAAFSGDELVYQETFGDWRVHAGTDYAGSSGTRVYAVAEGTVDTVEKDALWGTCITLSLSDGRKAVYKGLADKTKVKTGATVKAGDVIGTVGESIPAEDAQGAHLHFEMVDGDSKVDPESILGGETQTKQTAAEAGEAIPSGIDVEE